MISFYETIQYNTNKKMAQLSRVLQTLTTHIEERQLQKEYVAEEYNKAFLSLAEECAEQLQKRNKSRGTDPYAD